MSDKPVYCMYSEYSPKCPNIQLLKKYIQLLKKYEFRPVCSKPDKISDTGFELRTENCPQAGENNL